MPLGIFPLVKELVQYKLKFTQDTNPRWVNKVAVPALRSCAAGWPTIT
jgi:hypothetical protein